MPKISISSDKTQSLMLKYQSLVINPIVGAKKYQSPAIKLNR